MPEVQVVFYKEDDGTVPLMEWLDCLPAKAQDKCFARLKRLREFGHELRRPVGDYLRDEIYELRARHQGLNHRMLYFFHGRVAAVLSHGLTKERKVPSREIDKAIERKKKYEADPGKHTHKEA
jgi:hypothetical protein